MARETYRARPIDPHPWEVVCRNDGEEKVVATFPDEANAKAHAAKLDREAETTFEAVQKLPRGFREED